MILGRPDTIIVVAPELVTFYEFVKPRQETEYGSLVVLLDRRQHERRQGGLDLEADRRHSDRRAPQSDSARAQLSVLGFTVLHRVGEQYEA
jgi:hypothetical protein